ncbi:MAG: Metal binding domain of Ada, partial [Actinomycetota bacterium]|nr:Metal binding domain of Ada [Actinomycetota bacterium]
MTNPMLTEDGQWAAVLARDDADFYYSVRTTGVY